MSKQSAVFIDNNSSNAAVATFPRVFHDIDAKLYSVVRKQFVWHALLRTFAKAMTVNESAVAAFCVLQVKLMSMNAHIHITHVNLLNVTNHTQLSN